MDALTRLANAKEREFVTLFGVVSNRFIQSGDYRMFISHLTDSSLNYTQSSLMQHVENMRLDYKVLGRCVASCVMAGGRVTAQSSVMKADVTLTFNPLDTIAVQEARLRAGLLVTNVSTATKNAIRAIIVRGLEEGISPWDLAERLDNTVGLSKPHAIAVDNYNKGLRAGGVARRRSNLLARQYAQRLILYRAKVIARTEVLGAINAGQRAYWTQLKQSGDISPDMRRKWITTPDERTCPTCGPMNGKTVAIEGWFMLPTGTMVESPPAHPQCRCTTGLVRTRSNVTKHSPGGKGHDQKKHGQRQAAAREGTPSDIPAEFHKKWPVTMTNGSGWKWTMRDGEPHLDAASLEKFVRQQEGLHNDVKVSFNELKKDKQYIRAEQVQQMTDAFEWCRKDYPGILSNITSIADSMPGAFGVKFHDPDMNAGTAATSKSSRSISNGVGLYLSPQLLMGQVLKGGANEHVDPSRGKKLSVTAVMTHEFGHVAVFNSIGKYYSKGQDYQGPSSIKLHPDRFGILQANSALGHEVGEHVWNLSRKRVRATAKDRAGYPLAPSRYGMTDVHEFLAESWTRYQYDGNLKQVPKVAHKALKQMEADLKGIQGNGRGPVKKGDDPTDEEVIASIIRDDFNGSVVWEYEGKPARRKVTEAIEKGQ